MEKTLLNPQKFITLSGFQGEVSFPAQMTFLPNNTEWYALWTATLLETKVGLPQWDWVLG